MLNSSNSLKIKITNPKYVMMSQQQTYTYEFGSQRKVFTNSVIITDKPSSSSWDPRQEARNGLSCDVMILKETLKFSKGDY